LEICKVAYEENFQENITIRKLANKKGINYEKTIVVLVGCN